MEYKVLTQKDRFFSGKFDPEKLEAALNSYAEEGWEMITAVTATFRTAFSAGREEVIVFLQRGND